MTSSYPGGHRFHANLNKYVQNNSIEIFKVMALQFGMRIASFINNHAFLTEFSKFLDLFIQINQAMIVALIEVKNIFE